MSSIAATDSQWSSSTDLLWCCGCCRSHSSGLRCTSAIRRLTSSEHLPDMTAAGEHANLDFTRPGFSVENDARRFVVTSYAVCAGCACCIRAFHRTFTRSAATRERRRRPRRIDKPAAAVAAVVPTWTATSVAGRIAPLWCEAAETR